MRTDNEDVAQVPVVGHRRGDDAILGERNHSTVVEHSQHDNQDGGKVPACKTIGQCFKARFGIKHLSSKL